MRALVADEIAKVLQPVGKAVCQSIARKKPFVVLVVGVNGSGKTTTIGKLAATLCKRDGTRVMLAAADTFRAAAIEQLKVWGERTGAPWSREPGADAAGVAFEALERAKRREAPTSC